MHIKAPNIYIDTSICEHPAFTPGLNDVVFSAWKQWGISNLSDLYNERILPHLHSYKPFIIFLPQAFSDIYKEEILLRKIYQNLKF